MPLTFIFSETFTLPLMEVGQPITAYSVLPYVAGGFPDETQTSSGYRFSLKNAPSGIVIDEETGEVSGIPDQVWSSGSMEITVTDFEDP